MSDIKTELPSWYVELTKKPSTKKPTSGILNPPGYSHSALNLRQKEIVNNESNAETLNNLKVKKAWEIAMAPGKQIPMNAIMSYFSGSSLQIFSIMTTLMLFWSPFKAIVATSKTFEPYTTESIKDKVLPAKLVYILFQCLIICVGIWKVNSMGLLPTKRSDWVAWEYSTPAAEHAIFQQY